MTFDRDHYVPVLKVKPAEKAALLRVAPGLRAKITPLLDVIERRGGSVAEHLDRAFKGLAESAGGYRRCFLDVREIAPDGAAAAASAFGRAANAGIAFIPVTGVSRSADVTAALAHRKHGLALRLERAELESGALADRIRTFLRDHRLRPEGVDLIVDLGAVEDMITQGVTALAEAFFAEVPDHNRWRTFTLAACGIPKGMGGVGRNSHALVERVGWLVWRDHLYARRAGVARLPTFSDYAIQHVAGVEGFDPKIMKASAAIRYTTGDNWLLIKGEGTHRTRPTKQFPALAAKLVRGGLLQSYAGVSHCEGCASMEQAAKGAPKLGSLQKWRELGTIHHLTVVTQDLAALAWP